MPDPVPTGADRRRGTEYGPDNHPHRREGDTRRGKLRAFWRDVSPAVALVIAGIAVFAAGFAVLGTQSDVERQDEGRTITVDVLCGFGNGVAGAGRNVIQGKRADGQPLPGVRFTDKEKAAREAAAADYAAAIIASVQKEAGVADVPLNADGTINCDELKKQGQVGASK